MKSILRVLINLVIVFTLLTPAKVLSDSIDSENNGFPIFLPIFANTYPPEDELSEMVFVPAGEFQMGCDPAHNGGKLCTSDDHPDEPSDELPLHSVYLDGFFIDKYEVSNADYADCVDAGGCREPQSSNSYSRPYYYDEPFFADYPVIHVDWNQAVDYCTWMRKRLPTEAEWEKAARGTTVRAFPWGDEIPDCTYANYDNEGYCVGDTSAVSDYLQGASPYGTLNMAGNVWEWVSDWYALDYYTESPLENPSGPDSGEYKVLRGGAWYCLQNALRVAGRFYYHPELSFYNIGFRCAVSAP